MSLPVSTQVTQNQGIAQKAKPAAVPKNEKFSFRDLIDIVNPLQHIPVIGNIYRQVTGDEIKNVSRIAGGALFGGIAGAAVGAVNALAVHKTGEDFGQLAMDKVSGKTRMADVKNDENIPVIEVRPAARAAAKKDEIIWDEPVKLAEKPLAAPVEKSPVKQVEKPAENIAENLAGKSLEKPAEIASALPSAKELSELDRQAPEKPDTATPQFQPPEKAAIPQNMMQALAKYESMQRMAKTENEPQIRTSLNAKRPYEGLGNNIRRYN